VLGRGDVEAAARCVVSRELEGRRELEARGLATGWRQAVWAGVVHGRVVGSGRPWLTRVCIINICISFETGTYVWSRIKYLNGT
jgi:hypothetical protein